MKYSLSIFSADLSSSLVFYRALFGQMPVILNHNLMIFESHLTTLYIRHSDKKGIDIKVNFLLIESQEELLSMYKSLKNFIQPQVAQGDCILFPESIGIVDPDGNRWVLGKNRTTEFDQCYLEKVNHTISNQTI